VECSVRWQCIRLVLPASGGRYDVTSGLYHFRHRDYSPLGRWTSLDPLSYAAGDVNLVRYVRNNSTNKTDPSGLLPPDPPFPINEVERKLMDNANNRKVGEPGFVESLIPFLGSGREAMHSFENGKYLRGTFHAFLAVTDWFLITSIVTAGGKLLVKSGTNIASREAISETVVRLALKTSESIEPMAWKKSQGTLIVSVEVEGTQLWVKKVDPTASKFWKW